MDDLRRLEFLREPAPPRAAPVTIPGDSSGCAQRIDDVDDAARGAGRGARAAGGRGPAGTGARATTATTWRRERALLERRRGDEGGVLTREEREQVFAAVLRASRSAQRRQAADSGGTGGATRPRHAVVIRRALAARAALRGELRLPSDKSIAHRALICSTRWPRARPTITLRRPGRRRPDRRRWPVRTLGAVMRSRRRAVHGHGRRTWASRDCPVGRRVARLRQLRHTMRLLAGALAGQAGCRDADRRRVSRRRPMERVAGPLRAMGADVTTTDGHARRSRSLAAAAAAGDGPRLPVASAQVLGAISLRGAGAPTARPRSTCPARPATTPSGCWLAGRRVRRDRALTTTIDGPAGLRARSI